MSRTFVQEGEVLTLTAPTGGVTAGVPLLIGALFVVPRTTAAQTVAFDADVIGVHDSLPKTSAQAWTEGQKIYWDATAGECTTDATKGSLIGVAAAVAANPSATGRVRLNGCAPSTAEGPQGALADLGGTLTGTTDGSLADVAATAPACQGGSTPTATQVDTAINLAVSTIVSGVNTQLKELLEAHNDLLAANRAAGILAP